jgi:hypothetical protein
MPKEYDYRGKNRSGIEGEVELTREEVRAIKKLAERKMKEKQDSDEDPWVFPLGGTTWADLDNIRTKCKVWLRDNQGVER